MRVGEMERVAVRETVLEGVFERDTVLEAVFDGEAVVELDSQAESTSRPPALIVVAKLPEFEDAVKPMRKKLPKARVLSGAERYSSLLAIRV